MCICRYVIYNIFIFGILIGVSLPPDQMFVGHLKYCFYLWTNSPRHVLISLITLRVRVALPLFLFGGGDLNLPSLSWTIWALGCAEGWREKAEQPVISFGYGLFPVTVTTRIIPFLVGNPNKPFFATVTGKGPRPTYHHVRGTGGFRSMARFDWACWLWLLRSSRAFGDIPRPSEKKNLSSKKWMLLWKDGVLWFASFLFPCLIFIDVFLGLVVQLDFLKEDRTSFLLTLKRRCTPLTNRCLQWVTQFCLFSPLFGEDSHFD